MADSGPCRIGVIAAVGEQISAQKVGLTVFGNELNEVTAKGWGLDDLVVARVRAAAGGNGVRRIAFTKSAFTSAPASGSLFRNTQNELKNVVQQVTAGANCGRYVLVTPIASRLGSTNQEVRGIGALRWNALLNRAYVFALTYIRVFDGRSFEVIKHGAASIDGETALAHAFFGGPILGPYRQFDAASFPAIPSDIVDNTTIRNGARTLLTTSLDKTLPSLLQR